MSSPILALREISISYGHDPLLENVSLSVLEGGRLCLVGRNGCGKSTLLKIASGLVEADSGDRFIKPGVTFKYLHQEPDLAGFQTCLTYVKSGLGANDDTYKAVRLLEQFGLKPDENPNKLSVGQARQCALAKVLAPEPDILFLDEPTNHLDLTMITWLESYLERSKSALVLVSHDRYFLKTLTQATLWIDRGQIHYLDRGFGEFEPWRDRILEQEASDKKKLERKIHRENHWLIHGVTARRKRNQGRLRELHDMRRRQREARPIVGNPKLIVSESKSSGKRVIEAKSLFKTFDDTPVIKDFSIRIVRGERLGIIGSNGVGKTTLLKLLTGSLSPDSGQLIIGNTVELASLDQMRHKLNPLDTLAESLTVGDGDTVIFNDRSMHIHGYMKNFLFSPEQAGTPVKELSGGERARLMIAQALAKPSNLLVLDEPTNDLDVETLDILQEMLGKYHGTVLIVSHDRDFLDRIVTSLVVLEGDGLWTEYIGGYTDMLTQQNNKLIPTPGLSSILKKKKTTDNQKKQNSSVKSRLSYNDVYALKTLPGKIFEMEKKISELKRDIEVPNLYINDPDRFKSTVDKLQKAELSLSELEEEWLAIEILREELEGH